MPSVYVLNDMTHDYSTAERHGELVYVTEGRFPIFKTDTLINKLKEELKDFADEDFLLISGPSLLAIYSVPMLLKRLGVIKLLVFDAKQQSYVVRHINQDNL